MKFKDLSTAVSLKVNKYGKVAQSKTAHNFLGYSGINEHPFGLQLSR